MRTYGGMPDGVQSVIIKMYDTDKDGDNSILDFANRFGYNSIFGTWEGIWCDDYIVIMYSAETSKWRPEIQL